MPYQILGSSSFGSVMQFMGVLLIFVFVLVLTLVVTRWIAKYQQNQGYNKHISAIETFRITNNKFIQIIQIGEIYLVIAICKDTITLLAQVTKEELPALLDAQLQQPQKKMESFSEVLEKIRDLRPKK